MVYYVDNIIVKHNMSHTGSCIALFPLKLIIQLFGNYTYLLFDGGLDEKLDITLMSVQFIQSKQLVSLA